MGKLFGFGKNKKQEYQKYLEPIIFGELMIGRNWIG
jgi:hypothetical protein